MKSLRDFRFPLLVFAGSMITLLFTSYGNKKVHPDLNAFKVNTILLFITLFQQTHKK